VELESLDGGLYAASRLWVGGCASGGGDIRGSSVLQLLLLPPAGRHNKRRNNVLLLVRDRREWLDRESNVCGVLRIHELLHVRLRF